jgi:RNA polymerase sigma-70 factor (ECF subfamily)
MSDKGLADKCKAGDRAAMRILYERFYSPMLGVCLRYAANYADAEDFVQDGFIKVFNDIHSFKGSGSLEGWIRRVIINSVLMKLRKAKKEFAHDDMETTMDEAVEEPMSEDEKEVQEVNVLDFSQDEAVRIIQTLPEGFRKVLNLYVIDGYKHREIADMLDISVGTSKSQLNRARKLMKQKLIEYSKTKENETN